MLRSPIMIRIRLCSPDKEPSRGEKGSLPFQGRVKLILRQTHPTRVGARRWRSPPRGDTPRRLRRALRAGHSPSANARSDRVAASHVMTSWALWGKGKTTEHCIVSFLPFPPRPLSYLSRARGVCSLRWLARGRGPLHPRLRARPLGIPPSALPATIATPTGRQTTPDLSRIGVFAEKRVQWVE